MNTFFNGIAPQIAFILGLSMQACIKIFTAKDKTHVWKKLFSSIALSLFFTFRLYFDKDNHEPFVLVDFLILFGVLFTATACIFFRRQILSEVNELVLLVWNMGLFYLCFTIFGFESIILVPLALSLLAFFISLFHISMSRRTQIGLYIWFMLLGIYTSIALLPWKEIITDQSFSKLGVVHLFFLGQMLFYSFSYIVYLFYFVPMIDKTGKSANDTVEHGNIIEQKFDETQFHPYATVIVFFSVVGIFSLNYFFGLVDDKLLLAIVLGVSPFLGEKYHEFVNKS